MAKLRQEVEELIDQLDDLHVSDPADTATGGLGER